MCDTFPTRASPLDATVSLELWGLTGDASAGDLDGDGEYEIVVKQEQRPRDNSQKGATGETKLEAYKLDGTFLWRINLGKNIREGAHYTQFTVYDFDNDGSAELAVKTAPGTKAGDGAYLALGPAAADDDNAVPAPLRSILDRVRVELKTDLSSVAAALRTIADRADRTLDPAPFLTPMHGAEPKVTDAFPAIGVAEELRSTAPVSGGNALQGSSETRSTALESGATTAPRHGVSSR